MQPFVHGDCKNEITQYDLCSLICHYGSANGGHYTSFGRNYFNEEWYEYDDSYCKQVDSLTVQNTQAYVLFYK
jgi:ubiquitin carboxyl-terminal hydrolase 20/33